MSVSLKEYLNKSNNSQKKYVYVNTTTFRGIIINKRPGKKRYQGALKGKEFYIITIKETIKNREVNNFNSKIQVIEKLLKGESVWNIITQNGYEGKVYEFTCFNHGSIYKLHDLKEVSVCKVK